MPERCSANARSTAAFPVTAAPQLEATIAENTIARRITSAGRGEPRPGTGSASSVFEGVEDDAGRDEQRERDRDNERHAAEILCHVATLPRRRSLKGGR